MPNIKDVAKKTGLSVTTVSRVLNNRGYISEKTRKLVYDAMSEMNYQPNELARSLFRQRSNIIGVIVPSAEHPFFGKLLQSIEKHASQAGFKIMLCISRQDAAKEIEYLQMLQGNKVDGIILSSRTSDIKSHLNHQFPFVTIDRILSPDIPCISGDNYLGGRLATQHLIERGCRKIAHITGSPELQLQANRRDEAFIDVCRSYSIEPIVCSTSEFDFSNLDYYRDIEQLLTQHAIDGLFLGNDIMAAQAIQIAARLQLKVPDQLKIVGFDDIPLASLTTPSLTTIKQPTDEIGRYAVEVIINQLSGIVVPTQIILPVTLVQRQTT